MKLHELEIHNVRGICYVHLRPLGRNLLIWGSNGSGKSTVVDSLDFLFTGNISRLTGKGTMGIRLDKHGPHINASKEDAWVRAVIELPDGGDLVELRRDFKSKELEYDAAEAERLAPVLEAAQHGQNVLTRREILKYVTADHRTRATQVQELLRLEQLEAYRKALQSTSNKLKKEVKASAQDVANREVDTARSVGLPMLDEEAALRATNALRAKLGGGPVAELRAEAVRQGLAEPTGGSAGPPPGLVRLDDDLAAVAATLAEDGAFIEESGRLHAVIAEFSADPGMKEAFGRRELVGRGLKGIGEDGACPLCGTAFAPGELEAHLQAELKRSRKAVVILRKLVEFTEALPRRARTLRSRIQRVVDGVAAEELGDAAILEAWVADLQRREEAWRKPLSNASTLAPEGEGLADIAPEGSLERVGALRRAVGEALEAARPAADLTEALRAWTSLSRLEDHLAGLERARTQAAANRLAAQRALALFEAFEAEREAVLAGLYEQVGSRFTTLYRGLHGEDEDDFEADLSPRGAGLTFEVDFHGHGKHPPHALHSEGHQDSMGVCLYLALSEWVSAGVLMLTVLDDVVMSVDAAHRKSMAMLLKSAFEDRQFLVTTHDRAWMNQLRHLGVFPRDNIVEFTAWQLETGPRVAVEQGIWERIDDALLHDDVPRAAHLLRRGNEERFALLADKLGASVRYHLDGRVDFGEYHKGVQRRVSDLLGYAKKAANSWNDQEAMAGLKDWDSQRAQINERIRAEQWAVNANVHYNNWARFTGDDLRDVVDAFHDYWDLLQCGTCGAVYRTVQEGASVVGVRCDCGKVSWNLKVAPRKKR